MMREQHDKLQEEYSQQELLGGAASLGLQKGVDDKALADNQAYMSAVKSAADELATKGFIDAGRRRNLMGLKQQYITNVVPIQNALTERKKAIDIDRERRSKDSTYVSQFDPSKVAVTDYLGNANAFNARGVSGDAIYKDAAQAISNLKGIAASELPALKSSGLMDQYFTLMKNGLQPEQAAALMKKQSKSQAEAESWTAMAKMTVSAIDGAMQRHGAYDIFKDNPAMIDKLWQDTSKAAIFGLGENKVGQMTDEMSMYKRKKALEQTQEESPIILGNDMNTTIFDEGTASDIVNKLKTVKTGKPGLANLFNNDMPGFKNGKLTSASPTISGGDVVSFSSDGFKKRLGIAQKNYNDIKNALDVYRRQKGIKSNISDEAVYNQLMSDGNAKVVLQTAKQHEYTPIVDVQTGKQILSTVRSNLSTAEFVDYNTNFKGDSETGTDFTTIAKRSGFSSGEQLLDYIDKRPELISKNNTDGRFMMQVPTNVTGVDKQGNLTFEGNSPEYKHIGFTATNSHKTSVGAINKIRSRESQGKEDTVEISSRPIQSNGSMYTIKSFHNGKTGEIIEQLYDANGKKIKTQKTNSSSFINDENQNIYYGEIVNAYKIAHQKGNKSE